MSIGLKIKNLRKDKNLSVDQLAAEIGASRQIIYEYESGRVTPTPTKIQQLSKVLGIDSKELQQLANEPKIGSKTESVTWYQNKIDEMLDREKRFMDQIDRLTRMLENTQLGKLFDVTLGGLATSEESTDVKVISISEVANSVTSVA